MSKRIWKYKFKIDDEISITTKDRSVFLDCQIQDGEPCIWFLVDEDAPDEVRKFRIYGTGHPLPDTGVGHHMKTFTEFNGGLVWHLFEV